VEVGAIIAAALYKDDVEKALLDGFTKSMQNYGSDSDIGKEQTTTWDNMQERVSSTNLPFFLTTDPMIQ